MNKLKLAAGLLSLAAATTLAADPLTIEEFFELANADDQDAIAEAVQGMTLDERTALADTVTEAFEDSHRTALKMETAALELERLTVLRMELPDSDDAAVRKFFSMDPYAVGFEDYVMSMSLDESERLADALTTRFQRDYDLARRYEIVALEQETLLRRMALNPVNAGHPKCSPQALCRAGCTSRRANCDARVGAILDACVAHSNELYNNCKAGNPSRVLNCAGAKLMNLAACSAQRIANAQTCGLADMNCQTCCSHGDMFTPPTFGLCFSHLHPDNISLDDSLPNNEPPPQ